MGQSTNIEQKGNRKGYGKKTRDRPQKQMAHCSKNIGKQDLPQKQMAHCSSRYFDMKTYLQY